MAKTESKNILTIPSEDAEQLELKRTAGGKAK